MEVVILNGSTGQIYPLLLSSTHDVGDDRQVYPPTEVVLEGCERIRAWCARRLNDRIVARQHTIVMAVQNVLKQVMRNRGHLKLHLSGISDHLQMLLLMFACMQSSSRWG